MPLALDLGDLHCHGTIFFKTHRFAETARVCEQAACATALFSPSANPAH